MNGMAESDLDREETLPHAGLRVLPTARRPILESSLPPVRLHRELKDVGTCLDIGAFALRMGDRSEPPRGGVILPGPGRPRAAGGWLRRAARARCVLLSC